MKRIGNMAERAASEANVRQGVHDSLHHRSKHNALTKDAEVFKEKLDANVRSVMASLLSGEIGRMHYRTFYRVEHGKKRKIDWNPSFRDNVIQHVLYNVIGKRVVRKFIPDTYSGIEGRGRTYGMKRIRRVLSSMEGRPVYVLKGDIRRYYPSIDTVILKEKMRIAVKDPVILKLFDIIIDSHPDGLPIGNYISQFLANLYLKDFDRYAGSLPGIVSYHRYCDDFVLISCSKKMLWNALRKVRACVKTLGLSIKDSVSVFPVERYGIDFMGLVFHRDGITLRKRIERNFRRAAELFRLNGCEKTYSSLAAYYGWTEEIPRGRKLWRKVVGRSLRDCFRLVKRAAA